MSEQPDDDKLFAVYNDRLVLLAAQAEVPRHIPSPDLKARAISPICGSEVEIELKLKDNKISDFGFEVEACALTKSVVAVMQTAIIGKNRNDVRKASEDMSAMLEGGDILPSGDWADLGILQPVRDYKARHNSIMLPFEAVEKAFKVKE